MADNHDTTSSTLPNLDDLTDVQRARLSGICTFLKRPQQFANADRCPCTQISGLATYLVPGTIPEAGAMPRSLVRALETDFRQFETPFEISRHFVFYISKQQLLQMPDYWILALHRLLMTYTLYPRLRTRTGLPTLLWDNLGGFHDTGDPDDMISPTEDTSGESV